ncbi:unnamed protein product, partial [Nesidiocoris tenuis]
MGESPLCTCLHKNLVVSRSGLVPVLRPIKHPPSGGRRLSRATLGIPLTQKGGHYRESSGFSKGVETSVKFESGVAGLFRGSVQLKGSGITVTVTATRYGFLESFRRDPGGDKQTMLSAPVSKLNVRSVYRSLEGGFFQESII